MAQTPQSEGTGAAGGTTDPGAGRPQGIFGNSTTILLILFAAAVFLWSRRRRVEMEERIRAQRREAEATAERSALDVAHLMRSAPQPGAAAAAAKEGLASAAPMPSARATVPRFGATDDTGTESDKNLSDADDEQLTSNQDLAHARLLERAEAHAAAERAAEEQAQRAARDAELAGESAERRLAAATAAAEEAGADTVDAESLGSIGNLTDAGAQARQKADKARDEMLRRRSAADVPVGAVAGDGTASCPTDFPIKGNGQSRIYHRPGQVSYPSTVAEYCFASEEAAEAAGFRQSRARVQRAQR